MEAAVVPDTTRRTVQGPGRIFGLDRSAPEAAHVAECSFSDSVMVKAANRALAAASGPEEASFTWTSLQLNSDTLAKPQFDAGTIGRSAIVLLGTFTGGASKVDGMDDLRSTGGVRLFEGGR